MCTFSMTSVCTLEKLQVQDLYQKPHYGVLWDYFREIIQPLRDSSQY